MSRKGLYESITNLLVAIEVTRYQADIAMDVLAKMLETSPIPLNESVKVTKRLKIRHGRNGRVHVQPHTPRNRGG